MSHTPAIQAKLLQAIKDNDAVAVSGLLHDGADPDWADKDGWTPSHFATGNREILQMLLDAGSSPDGVGGGGPLWVAISAGHSTGVEILLRAGASTRPTLKGGLGMLHRAVECGHPEIAERLIAAGILIHATDLTGKTAMHYAARSVVGAKSIAVLAQHGLSVDARSRTAMTPLLTAAMYGQMENVTALVRLGADPLARNEEGASALDLAMLNTSSFAMDREDLVVWLLQQYPSLAPTGDALDKAFVQAVRDGSTEVVKRLAELGADVGQKPEGRTLLQCAPKGAEKLKRVLRALKTGARVEGAMGCDAPPTAPAAHSPIL